VSFSAEQVQRSVDANKPELNMSAQLPEWAKMALWIPLPGPGDFLQCQLTAFGLWATGTSRSKNKALAYALEDLAAQLKEAQ
jgi:hypothetical protein